MSAPGFTREFVGNAGVVIDLNTVILGGQVGVLESLKQQQREADDEEKRVEESLARARREVELLELDMARASARRDAVRMAYGAAKRAFDGE